MEQAKPQVSPTNRFSKMASLPFSFRASLSRCTSKSDSVIRIFLMSGNGVFREAMMASPMISGMAASLTATHWGGSLRMPNTPVSVTLKMPIIDMKSALRSRMSVRNP